MTLSSIDTKAVKETLLPLWQKTPTTARRVREKLESILDAATVEGLRRGENPARFKGHLEFVMPKTGKTIRKHHAALDYEDVPAFIEKLRQDTSVGALALEFTILTAARSGEALGAQWSEFDFKKKLWAIPATRMKAGRPHTVPLSAQAIAVIEKMKSIQTSENVFAGRGKGGRVSQKIMGQVLARLGVEGTTVHGFRSSFRDWAGNETVTPREVAEAALAHIVGDQAEQAYRRSDALDKRRRLMAQWADFCAPVAPVSR
jgi:integrase